MLKILIVDDEIDALEALEWKLNRYVEDVLITKCSSSLKAIEFVNSLKPDVVFLDIKMPEMDGFTFLRELPERNFNLIFTTAYDEFALKAIKVSALDYLLKPVDKDELIAAMNKVRKNSGNGSLEEKLQKMMDNLNPPQPKINITAERKVYILEQDDVIMLKSDRSYTTIFLKGNQQITVSKTLKEVEKKFFDKVFFRVHNSYLININHVKEYIKNFGGELKMSEGQVAKISRNKKTALLEKLFLE